MLVDVVSKNGNLLLNVGPKPDGTIPEEAQRILREVGSWLKVNGEAIYGSRPWTRFGEGPTEVAGGSFHEGKTKPYTAEDFRFTTAGGYFMPSSLGWPESGEVVVHSVGSEVRVKGVRLLGSGERVSFTQDAQGLHLRVPGRRSGAYAWVYRIEAGGIR